MALLTDKLTKQLLANGKATETAITRELEQPDHFPVIKLFSATGSATWLLSELDPDFPYLAFGLCDLGLGFPELGRVNLNELRSVRLSGGHVVERDLHFTATHPLSVYARAAAKAGGIVTDRASLDAAASAGGAQ